MNSSIQLAVKAFQEQRFPEAITLLEATVQARPGDFPARLMLAKAYQANGQLQAARMVFIQVMRETDQPKLIQMVQRCLQSLPQEAQESEIPAEEPAVFCPACGEPVPEDRRDNPWCSCGWNKPVFKRRLLLADLQLYAEKAGVLLAIKKGTDLYTIDRDEMRIMHLSDQSSPVDPRLVLRVEKGLAFILPDELSLVMPQVDDTALFRERKQKNDLSLGKLLDWDGMIGKIRDTLGADPTHRPLLFSLDEVLALYRVFPKDILDTAVEEAVQASQTVGQALLEQGFCSLRELLVGAIGGPRLFLPANHLANQLAFVLYEGGQLSREAFEAVLGVQSRKLKPISTLLTDQKRVSPEAMVAAQREVREVRIHLPETERIGELLIRRGAITRTELIQGLDEQKRKRRPLGKLLLELGSLKNADLLTDALHWQELKIKTRRQGRFRLGEILIERQIITREQLLQALIRQLDQPLPLGELLVGGDACNPEQLIEGLLLQEERINAYVESLIEKEILARKEGRNQEAQRKKNRSEQERARKERERSRAREREQAERTRKALKELFGRKLVKGLVILALLTPVGLGVSRGTALFARRLVPSTAPVATGSTGNMSGLPRELGGHPTYHVDVDAVMKDIGDGKENPLAAHTKPVALPSGLPSLEEAAEQLPVKPHPEIPVVMPESAVARPVIGNPALSEAQLKQALTKDAVLAEQTATDPAPCIRMGDALVQQGHPEKAIARYRDALKRDPESVTAHQQLGLVYQQAGKIQEAQSELRTASQLAPLSPSVQLHYANLLQESGQHDKALPVYHQAAATNPRDPQIFTRMGITLRARGDHAAAVASFRQAQKTAPKDPFTAYQVATTLEEAGKAKQAAAEYARAEKLLAGTADEHVRKGNLAKKRQNLRGSLYHYREAIRCRGMRADVLLRQGKACLALRDLKGAVPYFTAAKRVYRQNAPLHLGLGEAHLGLAQTEEAIAEFLSTTKIDPQLAPPYYYLGCLSQQQKKPEAARHFFVRFLSLRPVGPQAKDARRRVAQ